MRNSRTLCSIFWLTLCLFAYTQAAMGQIKSGIITGTVSDGTGASVPGANVSIINEATNVKNDVTASDDGEFTVPYLQAGKYSVSIEKAGFTPYKQAGIEVGTAQTVRVDAALQVGGVGATVDVVESDATLQTETSSVGGQVNEIIIDTVPNLSHNTLYYATLQPGVVGRSALNESRSAESFGIGIDARRNFSAISVNGGQAFANDIQLDGLSIQGSAWNEVSVLPNQEGIREVRTLVNNYSAEYGRGQGIILQSSKSGGNAFHGSLYERIRNEAFNANSFGENARSQARQPFKSNTFGGSVGGPIYLPRFGEGGPALFRGQDKAFFFASYEGLIHDRGIRFQKTVPTERERIGDFSQTYTVVNSIPRLIQIADPFSVRPGTAANQFIRAPIPNARIDQYVRADGTRGLDPFAARLVSYYPLPNRTPDPDNCQVNGLPAGCLNNNNYERTDTQTFRRNNFNGRLDFSAGRHSPYAAFGLTRGTILTPRSWGDDNPFYSQNSFIGNTNSDNNPYGAIGDTIVLNSTTVLDVRYGLTRIVTRNEADTFDGFDYSQFGIPAALQAINHAPGSPPDFSPFGTLNRALSNSSSLHKRENQTNHTFSGSLSKTLGNFNLKFGGEGRIYLSNYIDPEASYTIRAEGGDTRGGTTNQTGGGVAGSPLDPAAAGNPLASFLLGAGTITVPEGRDVRLSLAQKYFALYTQNDWRVNNRLTVNLGLRWDLQPGPTERYNRISSVDLTRDNPYGTPGRIVFPGTDGYGRNLWKTRYDEFAPRTGFALQLRDDFVIRGGYGLTYLPSNTGYFDGTFNYGSANFSNGFTDSSKYGTTPSGRIIGRYYEVNRLITGEGADPAAPSAYGGGTPRFDYTDYRSGVIQQGNFFVEKRLGNNWLVSAGYIATKGDHLIYNGFPINNDQLVPRSLLEGFRTRFLSDFLTANAAGRPVTAVNNPAGVLVQNPFQPATGQLIPFKGYLANRTITPIQAALPYPHLAGLQVKRSLGFSRYHAGQFAVQRRFSDGLQFNAHYTWSKSTDVSQSDAQQNQGYDETGGSNISNYLDLRQNKKLSVTDIPHRFVATFTYELPFGSNKFLDFNNRFANALFGGFRLSGVALLQSGVPLVITGANGGSINGRPDRVAGVATEVPKELQRWYDGRTAVVVDGRTFTPPAFTFLKYNPNLFQGRVITAPNGVTINDVYWFGNAALTYDDLRSLPRRNLNLSLERTIRFGENLGLDISAQFTNVFNNAQFNPSGFTRDLGGTVTQITATTPPGVVVGQGSSNSFGTYGTGTADPRQIEFQARFRF